MKEIGYFNREELDRKTFLLIPKMVGAGSNVEFERDETEENEVFAYFSPNGNPSLLYYLRLVGLSKNGYFAELHVFKTRIFSVSNFGFRVFAGQITTPGDERLLIHAGKNYKFFKPLKK